MLSGASSTGLSRDSNEARGEGETRTDEHLLALSCRCVRTEDSCGDYFAPLIGYVTAAVGWRFAGRKEVTLFATGS